jgi:hypothetical protein
MGTLTDGGRRSPQSLNRVQVALRIIMFCCRGSNALSRSFATPSAASSRPGWSRDFKTPIISPACFENLRAPPLQSSERIIYRGRPLRSLLMLSNTTAKCIYRVARRFGSKPPCDNSRIVGHSKAVLEPAQSVGVNNYPRIRATACNAAVKSWWVRPPIE